jgi:hypothetical protein
VWWVMGRRVYRNEKNFQNKRVSKGIAFYIVLIFNRLFFRNDVGLSWGKMKYK